MNLLHRSSLRYLDRHRWQFGLSIVGVALGVAVVVSVDLANASAQRAFEVASATVTGRATHQAVAGPGGIPDEVFVRLRVELGLRRVAPVVEGYVGSPEGPDTDPGRLARPLRLLGVDPFSEAAFRVGLGTGPLQLDLRPFLTRPGAVVMSAGTAASLGVAAGDRLPVRVGTTTRDLLVTGVLEAAGSAAEAAVDLLVGDVATAQEVLGAPGRLTRLDLIFDDTPAGAAQLERVRDALPDAVRLVDAAARSGATRQMTRAFRLNLAALSLLALVCGAFLVYNTMSFSVIQRRELIGTLRALGVTRREVFTVTLGEALVVGLAGTVLGLVGGVVLGHSLVGLVTRTINDLYFVVAVRDLALDPASLAKGALLGVMGAVAAALPAAREATRAPPGAVLMRSQVEARARSRALPLALAGMLLLATGAALLAVSGRDLVLSFAALFCALLAFALMTPAAVIAAMRVAAAPMGALLGPLGRIAARGVSASLSRTAVAVAALMIAVAMVIGVGVMIGSFRGTVTRWLDTVLVADLYVTAPSPGRAPTAFTLTADARARLEAIDGVRRVGTQRHLELPAAGGGRTRLVVHEIDTRVHSAFPLLGGDEDTTWTAFARGDAVLISEPYAYRHGLGRGDTIELLTDRGARDFRVAGVYTDYAAEEGLVVLDRATYERYWDDRALTSLTIYLLAGADEPAVSTALRAALDGDPLQIRSHRALRQASLDVFDRTFLITGVLRLLVTLVAIIGVFSALMSLQLERAHEIGVLRALGLTPREVWRLSVSQSGLMGLVAGALAVPVGLALAAIMIFVINRRSFGWTLQMEAAPEVLLQGLAIALAASLAAGLYPARRMSATRPAVALREE